MTREHEHASSEGDQAASTGISGLDTILRGGLHREEMHLVEGSPGTGKTTTLALQFLLAGARAGESGLYITLSQTRRSLEAIALSHGWSLEELAASRTDPGARSVAAGR